MPYRAIEDPVQLRRVLEATLLFQTDMDLASLLRHVTEEARSMTGARYGALGVLNEEGSGLSEFITVGLDDEAEERIGVRPTGKGVLGLLVVDPRPLRLSRLSTHPESWGFPAGHPPMTSFLGVPVTLRDQVFGNLYLTDKVGWSEFTKDDEVLAEALATAAGIAIENARLHERVRIAAVYEDRDRVARDLHDAVISRLFALGLALQSLAGSPAAAGVADRIATLVAETDTAIRHIRSSIFELASDDIRGLRAAVLALVRELSPVIGFAAQVTFDGPVDAAVTDQVAEGLLLAIREALTNIGRHAHATQANVSVAAVSDTCHLEVLDNGRGVPPNTAREGGLGLANLQRRAEKLHGTFALQSPTTGGTLLVWEVPLTQ